MPVATGKTDGTATATDHAAHHNDLATAANASMGLWKPIFQSYVSLAAAAANTYGGHQTNVVNVTTASPAPTATAHSVIVTQYIDPADYAVTGWTTQIRLIASFAQNAVANAATSVATAGLYPVTAAGATTIWAPTLGAVVAGTTAARTGGAASSEARVASSTITMPAADTYAMAVAVSVATTAGATRIGLRLEYRHA